MSETPRERVAKEAASLLYLGIEEEYKQAKVRAAEDLGIRVLPSNLEVALELDRFEEELEGGNRKERLVQMRKDALRVMGILKAYSPVLIGSVWRGNIRRRSDIDITVYSDLTEEITEALKANNIKITKKCRISVNKQGKTLSSFHVHAESTGDIGLEIVIRSVEEIDTTRKCDIFGDEIKGLKIQELERVLKENPLQKFIPK